MKALIFISFVALLSGLCYLIHKDIIIGAASVFASVAVVFRFLDKFKVKKMKEKMEIFGYTIIKTHDLWNKEYRAKRESEDEIKALKMKIDALEDKVYNQRFQIEQAEDAKNRAQRDRALTQKCYEKVCKENRHLEAEIKRMKERW